MKKILFVCLGNICRSPMAEYIMKNLLKEKNIKDIYVESKATSKEELGNDIYPPAKKKLKEKKIPFQRHFSRQISVNDFKEFDYIICMDNSNLRDLLRICPNEYKSKISMLLEGNKDLLDPWYTNDFETTFNDINNALRRFLDNI